MSLRAQATWLKERLKHKITLLSPRKVKEVIKTNGVSIAIIFVAWELVEDFLLPTVFVWLGTYVHSFFYTLAPISVFLCLHPIAVPALHKLYKRFAKGDMSDV